MTPSPDPARDTTTPTRTTCCSVRSSNARRVSRCPQRYVGSSASNGSVSTTRGGSELEPAPAGVGTRAHQTLRRRLRQHHARRVGRSLRRRRPRVDRQRRDDVLPDAVRGPRLRPRHHARPDAQRLEAWTWRGAAIGIYAATIDGVRCYGHRGYWGTEAYACPALDAAFTIATNQADETKLDTTPVQHTLLQLAGARR